MNSFSSLLPAVLQQLPLSDEWRERVVMALWEKAVGKTLAQNARPLRLHVTTLVVAVPSEAWRRELFALRFEILKRLEAVVGETRVSSLEFRVNPWLEPLPRPVAALPATAVPAAADSASENLQTPSEPFESISDPELERSLAAAASSYFCRPQK